MLLVEECSPLHPPVRQLIRELDELMYELYPAECNHPTPVETMIGGYYFVCARDGDTYLGCGAVTACEDGRHCEYAEMKRIFVSPKARGQGVGEKIVGKLEAYLISQGVDLVKLETGIYQPEAIGLYKKLGYRECGVFGDYLDERHSVFMEKVLGGFFITTT